MERYEHLRRTFVDGIVRQCEAYGDDLKKALAEQAVLGLQENVQTTENIIFDKSSGENLNDHDRRAPITGNSAATRKFVSKTTPTERDDVNTDRGLPKDGRDPSINHALTSFTDDTLPLDEKYNILLKKYKRMRQQAHQYKHGFETYQEAYAVLRERFRRSKVNIRDWQDFADRTRARSPPKARHDVDHRLDLGRPHPVRRHSIQVDGRTGRLQRLERPVTGEDFTRETTILPITPLSMDLECNRIPSLMNPEQDHVSSEVLLHIPQVDAPNMHRDRSDHCPVDATFSNSGDSVDINCPTDKNGLLQESSQTTEEDSSSRGFIVKPEDDFEPVVVSERSLKRKRSVKNKDDSSRPSKCMPSSQDGSSNKPIKIKDEPSSSSPVGSVLMPGLFNEQSLDLDDVQGFVLTPKKRKERSEQQKRTQNAPRHTESHRSTHDHRQKVLGNRAISAPVDCPANDAINKTPKLQGHLSRSFENKSNRDDADDEMLLTWDAEPTLDKPLTESSENMGLGATVRKRIDVLQPRSVNDLVTPGATGKVTRSKIWPPRNEKAIAELAEDEEFNTVSRFLAKHPKPVSTRITTLLEGGVTSNRNLLTSPPTSNKSKPLRPAPPKTVHSRSAVTTPSIPQTGKDGFGWPLVPGSRSSSNPSSALSLAKSRLTSRHVRERSDPARPEQEPLRARPLHRLNLECFKVNPKCNNGYKYAFNDVVRNQAARACLPGCNLPSCCGGAFEKAIQLGGALPPPKRGLWDDSQEDPDDALLKEYLGGNHNRVNAMSAEERARLLTKARANKLAEMHGRHRQAHQRQASPPGFWRMEMPTTQENEEDRQRAKELERERVAERYREAMRPGGRWMFADE